MTVKELIEKLQTMNPDYIVNKSYYEKYDCGCCEGITENEIYDVEFDEHSKKVTLS